VAANNDGWLYLFLLWCHNASRVSINGLIFVALFLFGIYIFSFQFNSAINNSTLPVKPCLCEEDKKMRSCVYLNFQSYP
jgi:hypothetical protein